MQKQETTITDSNQRYLYENEIKEREVLNKIIQDFIRSRGSIVRGWHVNHREKSLTIRTDKRSASKSAKVLEEIKAFVESLGFAVSLD